MSILIDRSSRVVVHGLTGREGSFHGAAMLDYGTNVVAGMTPAKLDAILANQMPDSEKRARAHFVVDSSRGLDSARVQVRGILRAVAAMPGRRKAEDRRPTAD